MKEALLKKIEDEKKALITGGQELIEGQKLIDGSKLLLEPIQLEISDVHDEIENLQEKLAVLRDLPVLEKVLSW